MARVLGPPVEANVGAKPTVSTPAKFETVLNMKTAKALSLEVPDIVRAAARRRGDRLSKLLWCI
jgi:hypothetical protein